jgi:outer membrane protein, heavy metal efflux system
LSRLVTPTSQPTSMVTTTRARRCALLPLAAVLLAGLAVPASAQALRTEAEVMEAVRQHSLALQAAHARARAEAERPDQVRWPFPMAEVMGMPQMIARGDVGVAVMARQTIPQAGRLRADRDARVAMADAAALEADLIEREQVLMAHHAYSELWGLQERSARIDTFRTHLAFYREAALAQYRTGRGPQQAVLNIQVESEMLAQRIDVLEEQAVELRAQIALMTGGAVRIRPADRLAPPEGHDHLDEETLALLIEGHPLVATSEAMREAEEAMVRMNRTMLRPEFTVGATLNLSMHAREGRYGQEVFTPTLGVMLPLWRDGVRAQVREAEARVRQRGLEADHSRLVLAAELDDALSQIARVRARIARYEADLLPTARQALETALLGYQTGAVRFLELLDAQRMTLDIELDLIEARVREAALAARLDALVGH